MPHLTLQNIIKKYLSGELSRKNDERYAGGFWDYAWDELGLKTDEQKEQMYNELLEVFEITKKEVKKLK